MPYSILSHIGDVAQKIVSLIDDNSSVEMSQKPDPYHLVHLSFEPNSDSKEQLKAALTNHPISYALYRDKLFYIDRNFTAHRVFVHQDNLQQLTEIFPPDTDKSQLASEQDRDCISRITRCNALIAVCIKAYERYVNEAGIVARAISSYVGGSIAASIGLSTRDENFETLINHLRNHDGNNYLTFINEFTSYGGWESNSANTLLLYELIYSAYPSGIKETEESLFQHAIASGTLKDEFFVCLSNNLAMIAVKKEKNKEHSKVIEKMDLSSIALFHSDDEAKEHQRTHPNCDTVSLINRSNEPSAMPSWELNWYDAQGDANYLPINSLLSRKFANFTDSVKYDIKLHCHTILTDYPNVYLFEDDNKAQTFIKNHPEEHSFLIEFSSDKWQIHSYDIEGNKNALDVWDELKLLLNKQLDPILKMPKPDMPLIPYSTSKAHFELKSQCHAFLKNRLARTKLFLNTEPVILPHITSWFIVNHPEPLSITLCNISGNEQAISLDKYPKLFDWLNKKNEINEEDALKLATILVGLELRGEVNPDIKKTIQNLFIRQPKLSLFIGDNFESIKKWNRQRGSCYLIGKTDNDQCEWTLHVRSKRDKLHVIDTSTKEWGDFRQLLTNKSVNEDFSKLKQPLLACIERKLMRTQLLAANDLSNIPDDRWNDQLLGDCYILWRESLDRPFELYQRDNGNDKKINTDDWELLHNELEKHQGVMPELLNLSALIEIDKVIQSELKRHRLMQPGLNSSKQPLFIPDEFRRQAFKENQIVLSELLKKRQGVALVVVDELSSLKQYQLIPGTYYFTNEKRLYQRVEGKTELLDTSGWPEVHRILAEIKDTPLESLSPDTIKTIQQAIYVETAPKKEILVDQKPSEQLDRNKYKNIMDRISGNPTASSSSSSSSSSSMDISEDKDLEISFSPPPPPPPLPGAPSFFSHTFNRPKKSQPILIQVREIPVLPETDILPAADTRYGM